MIAEILVAHLVGDYLIQSHWMANAKTKHWWPAILHAVTYGLPFLFITLDWQALAIIVGTHAVIDRYRLARHVVWARNWLSPISVHRSERARFRIDSFNPPWRMCRQTGFPPKTPMYIAFWCMVLADNTMHILINIGAVAWFG